MMTQLLKGTMKKANTIKKTNKNVAAIILAAGSGQRAGGIYKQFLLIGGKPLLFHSLEKFLEIPIVGLIILVVPQSKIKHMNRLLNKIDDSRRHKVVVIPGGRNRQESAFLALQRLTSITNGSYGHVFFHDAARPMISVKMIKKLHAEALAHGASTVGVPAIDLLFKVKDNFIEKAVNKLAFYYGFTPQCLPITDIWHAHTKARKTGMVHDVDNIELLKKFSKNLHLKILDNFYPNVKMTYPEDVRTLTFLLSDQVSKKSNL